MVAVIVLVVVVMVAALGSSK